MNRKSWLIELAALVLIKNPRTREKKKNADGQKSAEQQVEQTVNAYVELPTAGSGSNVPQGPGGGGRPSGGGGLPSPQIPQSPQVPQLPQLPQR